MKQHIRISIIMATYNAAAQLERTLRSVERQCYSHWEIIVQDGGSTDGTLEILESHRASVSWVSEPDRGIYDAWNKAVARASGDWALFLGADDFLMNDNVLAQCVHFLKKFDDDIIFAYGVLLMGANGNVSGILNRSRHEVFSLFISDMGLPFPATFIRMNFLKTHHFDTVYKIAGDFAFCAEHIRLDNLARLPVCVSFFELTGVSSSENSRKQLLRERLRILKTKVEPRIEEFTAALMGTAESSEQEHGFIE